MKKIVLNGLQLAKRSLILREIYKIKRLVMSGEFSKCVLERQEKLVQRLNWSLAQLGLKRCFTIASLSLLLLGACSESEYIETIPKDNEETPDLQDDTIDDPNSSEDRDDVDTPDDEGETPVAVVSLDNLEVSIAEHQKVGSPVGRVSGVNIPDGASYEIVTQFPEGAIDINAETGEISVLNPTSFVYVYNQQVTGRIAVSHEDVFEQASFEIQITDVIIENSSFAALSDDNNPLEMFNLISSNAPSIGDIDNDGDVDVILGGYESSLYIYKNNGEDNFDGVEIPDSYARYHTLPSFIDFDQDGDLDLLVHNVDHNSDEEIVYFENDGSGGFTKRTGDDYPFDFSNIDNFSYLSSAMIDLDQDGDFDLLIENTNEIEYYENDGTGTFMGVDDMENPFHDLELLSVRDITAGDVDDDGDMDLVVGHFNGTLSMVENMGENIFEVMAEDDNPFRDIRVDDHAIPDLADFDNDGDLDLIINSYENGLSYYENKGL